MGVYGISQATIAGVANPTIARFYGRTHHGAIRGFITTAIVMGTGGGPWLFAFGYTAAGEDFGPAMLVFACLAVPLGLAAAWVRKPPPPAERDLTPDALDRLVTDEPDPPGAAL
jgi:OFA family oxalate/formate antiporter-like MFS transporter